MYELEEENRHFRIDLQAYQQQLEGLSRAMEQQEKFMHVHMEEKNRLIAEVTYSQQMSYDFEQVKHSLQQEIATMQARVQQLDSQLGAARSENEALSQRLNLERGHVLELETLMGDMRRHEHQVEIKGMLLSLSARKCVMYIVI